MNLPIHLIIRTTLRRQMRGVTLIELMISLTIGLLIIAGIGYAYLGSRQSFRSQDALSRMQEGARTAFELMDKDIRMAGFRGCPPNSAANGDINILSNPNTWYKNLIDQPLIGYEKTDENQAWSAFPTGVTDVVGSVINGDALTILHASTEQSFIIQAHDAGAYQFTLSSDSNIKPGRILIAAESDCSRVAVFQNSDNTEDDDIVTHSSGAANAHLGSPSPPDTSYTLYTFTANSRIFPLSAATYYIGRNTDNEPSLYRATLSASGGNPVTVPEELIEGVQDMQIVYGMDTNAPSCKETSKVVEYHTADDIDAGEWCKVIAIRISLLMVSRQDEQGITTEPQTYTFNGGTNTPDDRLLRKTFTTTIAVKNRL